MTMKWTTPLRGHCFCKACEYTVDPNVALPDDSFVKFVGKNYLSMYDHCQDCRRATSSMATAWLIVPTPYLVWSEASSKHLKTYVSSEGDVKRCFCGQCGTPFTYWQETRVKTMVDAIDITIPSLCEEDLQRLDELEMTPTATHYWWDSGVGWYKAACLRSAEENGVWAYKLGARGEEHRVQLGN